MPTLEGRLDRITYYNEETHYTVARLKPAAESGTVTVVGIMAAAREGEAVKLGGTWETHPKFGQQFKFKTCEVTLPESADGIRKYLKSGIIKGIGKKTADRLIRCFGEETLKIIESHPEKLTHVNGIGKAAAAKITASWQKQHGLRLLMQFLQDAGVDAALCGPLYSLYGADAPDMLKQNPYRLVTDGAQNGFPVAEAVARVTGFPANDPRRIRAGLFYMLQQFAGQGHMFAPEAELIRRSINQFRAEPDMVASALTDLSGSGYIVIEPADKVLDGDQAVYLKDMHEAEAGIARRIKAMLSIPLPRPMMDTARIADEVRQTLTIDPSPEQVEVLNRILSYRIAIITGGPGTGKTTLIRALTTLYRALGRQVILAAPTGRASRRLAEVTGRNARTIHRLLGYGGNNGLFERNRDNPLKADVVIADEVSMIDTSLLYHLLNAVPVTSVLILVGDAFQLPSVGPGNVLSDLIASDSIPVFYLKTIFRQARESAIIMNAHRIREGEHPVIEHPAKDEEPGEFYFIPQSDPQRAANQIVRVCSEAIPRRFSLDPVNEIQVLCPMHRGETGTIYLNQLLQAALNPHRADGQHEKGVKTPFRTGDKVMHLKNNYQKDVFNGDIGTVVSLDRAKKLMQVDYEGRVVEYTSEEFMELSLAYAISVHKSQGSEYPAIVMPLLSAHHVMLQRNLLYTAITRGKQLVVIVGEQRALDTAIKNNRPAGRLSGLASRLGSNL